VCSTVRPAGVSVIVGAILVSPVVGYLYIVNLIGVPHKIKGLL